MIDDPVEILVKLAENGEINPWNIDIIEVCDRFFAEMEKQQILDLKISARTLLYAATLLRIKSDYLIEPAFGPDNDDIVTEEYDQEAEDRLSYSLCSNPVAFLEHEIKRRLERKNMRRQPITLYDLIALLRNAEKEERRRQRDGWVQEAQVYTEDIVSIAHDETFHQSAMEVLNCYSQHTSCGERMSLSELAERLNWPVFQVFIPLLFLMQEGHLWIFQETFFDEVFIGPMLENIAAVDVSDGISVL